MTNVDAPLASYALETFCAYLDMEESMRRQLGLYLIALSFALGVLSNIFGQDTLSPRLITPALPATKPGGSAFAATSWDFTH